MTDTGGIQADFDRLALMPLSAFDPNICYHDFLLRQLPVKMGESLELGCGTGQFARALSVRADRVLGVDFSANMLGIARERSVDFPNIEFEQGDLLRWDWPVNRFDCVVSIATLHHLPLEQMLGGMKAALRPGGVLLVLDISRPTTLVEFFLGAIAYPVNVWMHWRQTGRLRPEAAVRKAWLEHGKTDRYLSVAEVRETCARILTGAIVRRHLLWRYSLVWRKS